MNGVREECKDRGKQTPRQRASEDAYSEIERVDEHNVWVKSERLEYVKCLLPIYVSFTVVLRGTQREEGALDIGTHCSAHYFIFLYCRSQANQSSVSMFK